MDPRTSSSTTNNSNSNSNSSSNNTARDQRRTPEQSSNHAAPTFLTSFPSLSPPTKKNGPSTTESTANYSTIKQKLRAVSSPAAKKPAQNSSAMNRTVQAAANLRRTIMDSIASRNNIPASPGKIFNGEEEEEEDAVVDPLAGAREESVIRVINTSGGAVAAIKKYSADLAEANQRCTSERNSKLKLVEENRQLRAQMQDKEDQMEELLKLLTTTKELFGKYVAKVQADLASNPQVQILQSPAGPYALEDSSGTILAALEDDFMFPSDTQYASSEHSSVSFNNEFSNAVQRGKSMDTIRPKKQPRPAKLPQRLVSTIKAETVEMKSPVDVATLPPALRDASTPTEALVDRLGFYITPDRERRHQEASEFSSGEDASESSSINSTNKEDDDSFISTNELLCDAPMTPAARLIFRSESSSRIFIQVDKTTSPAENTGFTSPVTATHVSGGIAAPTSATSSLYAALNPIQDSKALSSLLIKLNQAYDLQQKRRMKAWTTFYENTRDLLQKTSDEPLDENHISGVTALSSAANLSLETRSIFNSLIRRGIPVSFRREVWLERSGANNIRDSAHYAFLLASPLPDTQALKEITVDVERTLSNNIFFRNGPGKQHLKSVLIAFASQNPDIGYSQGLNIIAANLLLMVPYPEDGFALLEVLVKDILPAQYYARDGSISGSILSRDGAVLSSYLLEFFPSLYKHLDTKGAPLTMFTPGWFISGFAACVNGEALYRLWDLVFGFCDGRFIFCFALALLKLNKKGLMSCPDAESLMSYLGGRMSNAAVSLDILINETFRMGEKVTLGDVSKRRDLFSSSSSASSVHSTST